MPFAVRTAVAMQLKKMQDTTVIRPSSSPWASPVVMVHNKDGSHRFCVDYRGLNSVTMQDSYPLPRIDDLLDQLCESYFFSTLDLAQGIGKFVYMKTQFPKQPLSLPTALTNASSVSAPHATSDDGA